MRSPGPVACTRFSTDASAILGLERSLRDPAPTRGAEVEHRSAKNAGEQGERGQLDPLAAPRVHRFRQIEDPDQTEVSAAVVGVRGDGPMLRPPPPDRLSFSADSNERGRRPCLQVPC